MIIRHATHADMPAILAMSEQFYAKTSYPSWAPFDGLSVETLTRMLFDIGIILVAEEGDEVIGMLAVIMGPHEFNHAKKVAGEVVWWVNEDMRHTGAGVALLRATKPAAAAAGCHAIRMMVLADSPPAAIRLYEHEGYVHTESTYTLVLEGAH
jgi:GNAT superfamily N-acetyltransferase